MHFIITVYIHPFSDSEAVDHNVIVSINKGKCGIAALLILEGNQNIFHFLNSFRHLQPQFIQPVLPNHISIENKRGIRLSDHRCPCVQSLIISA